MTPDCNIIWYIYCLKLLKHLKTFGGHWIACCFIKLQLNWLKQIDSTGNTVFLIYNIKMSQFRTPSQNTGWDSKGLCTCLRRMNQLWLISPPLLKESHHEQLGKCMGKTEKSCSAEEVLPIKHKVPSIHYLYTEAVYCSGLGKPGFKGPSNQNLLRQTGETHRGTWTGRIWIYFNAREALWNLKECFINVKY